MSAAAAVRSDGQAPLSADAAAARSGGGSSAARSRPLGGRRAAHLAASVSDSPRTPANFVSGGGGGGGGGFAADSTKRRSAQPRGRMQPRTSTPRGNGFSCGTVVKWVAVATALAAVAVAVIEILVYLGQLQVAWAGVGAMTQTTGLYTLLAGAGAAGIITILLAVKQTFNNKAQSGSQPRGAQVIQENTSPDGVKATTLVNTSGDGSGDAAAAAAASPTTTTTTAALIVGDSDDNSGDAAASPTTAATLVGTSGDGSDGAAAAAAAAGQS